VGLPQDEASDAVLGRILSDLVAEGELKKVGNTFAMADHSVKIPPELQRKIDLIERTLKNSGMQTPLMSDLQRTSQKNSISERDLNQILRYLLGRRVVYHIEDNYLHASVVDKCRTRLVQALRKHPGGMTVAQFRDLVSGNRRICLLMLSQFDSEGTTVREGDVRVLGPESR
jgi:hypothetical protein